MTPVRLSRWQGGKGWLVTGYPHLLPVPCRGRFFDVCAGSCVVAFWALAQGYRVVIGDTNARLIGTLRNLQRRAEDVVRVLTDIAEAYRKATDQREDFYARRECLNRLDPADVGASALFLFILRAGFNGLYRENASGECNTTWGDPYQVTGRRDHGVDNDIVRADELRAIGELLGRANIHLGDFEATSADVRRSDVVFADPPYAGTFTAYSKGGFGLRDRARLGMWLRDLDRRGVRWTATDAAHGLATYGLWHVQEIDVRRSSSARAKGRGTAREVVVTNWTPSKEQAA